MEGKSSLHSRTLLRNSEGNPKKRISRSKLPGDRDPYVTMNRFRHTSDPRGLQRWFKTFSERIWAWLGKSSRTESTPYAQHHRIPKCTSPVYITQRLYGIGSIDICRTYIHPPYKSSTTSILPTCSFSSLKRINASI